MRSILARLRLLGTGLFALLGIVLAAMFGLSLLIPTLESVYGPIIPVLIAVFVVSGLSTLLPKGVSEPEGEVPSLPDDMPLSGPTGQKGEALVYINLFASQILAVLNPFQLVQMIAQGGGQLIAVLRRTPPMRPDDVTLQTTYRLPFEGEWYIMQGGVTPETSHSWDLVAQRYAYDFVQVDEDLRRHEGRGDQLSDYYCYGEPILAAADGEVITVRDGIRDAPNVGGYSYDWLARDFRGNFVIIKHAEGEYSFSTHLIPDSITVEEGQRVQQGQPIGRCGHSGYSTEPHLHWHLQDHPNMWVAVSLPVTFEQVQTRETSQPSTITVVRGTHVQHATSDPSKAPDTVLESETTP